MDDRRSEISATLGLESKKRHWWRWLLAIGLLVLAGVLGYQILSSATGDGETVYRTEAATTGDLTVTITATGTIEPLNVVEISSELSGTLVAVNAGFNDQVAAGEVLAELDTTKLEAQLEVQRASHSAAAAQLASAEATRDEATDSYETELNLFDRGVVTQSALEAARAAKDRADAAYEVAAANLDLSLANFQAQQAELEKACICSPIDGVVLDVKAESGQIVAASLSAPTLFTIAEDLSQMELRVDVAEADIGVVAEGNSARFTVEAYDQMSFPAEITQIRYASEMTDGLVTYKAILAVENPDLLLRPGMTAVAEIEVAHHANALLVPNAALRYVHITADTAQPDEQSGGGLLGALMPRRDDSDAAGQARSDGKSVWVLRDGAPVQVAVDTGDSDGTNTVILAGDLSEGDKVIVARTTAE